MKYHLLSIAVIVMASISFSFFDLKIASLVNLYASHLTQLFKAISLVGDSVWYLVPSLVIALAFKRINPGVAMKAWFLFTSVAVSGIVANIIKFIFGRPRPGMYISEGLKDFQFFETASRYLSLPSGHATTVFSVAVFIAYLYPRFKWLAFVIAVIVAVSRVMVNKHFVSDVMLGSVLGAYTSMILYHCYYRQKIYGTE